MRSNIGNDVLPMMRPGRIAEAVSLPVHEADGNLRFGHDPQHVGVGLTTGNIIDEGGAGRNGSGRHARPHGVHGCDNARPTQLCDDRDNARMFDLFGHAHRPWPSGFAPHINEVRTRITQCECVFDSFVEVNKFIKDFNQAKQLMQGVMSGDMNKMMKQMGINPNNLPKNMPNMGGMDMSALEGMMGQGGMPDLSALGGAGMPDMSQMFGGGLKGKIGEFAMKQSMKRMANKMKKAKKKRK